MKEKTLLKIALICSITGLFILYILSENISIEEKTIDKIDKSNFGEYVKVKGTVDKVINTENVVIIDVVQPQKISVVLFKEDTNISINEGSEVEVIGKVEDYNGEMEIIGSRVRVIY